MWCCICALPFRVGQRMLTRKAMGDFFVAEYHVHCLARYNTIFANARREAKGKGMREAAVEKPAYRDRETGEEVSDKALAWFGEHSRKLSPLERLTVELRRKAQAREELMLAANMILRAIGEDPAREDLIETPRRFADAWMEFAFHRDDKTDTTFEAVEADQIVCVRGIRVWSICEHHLLPFWCDVTIAYLGKDRILGLSKFARIAVKASHRLQTQERLARDIADEIATATGSEDVAVLCSGEHTCMSMRGVRQQAVMRNVVVRGAFRSEPATRAEFYSLAQS